MPMFSYVGRGFASGSMFDNFPGSLRSAFDNFRGSLRSPAAKPTSAAPESFDKMPRFRTPGLGGLLGTMGSGALVGGVMGGIASGGEAEGYLKGAAAGAFGGAVARRMYQPTLLAANRGAKRVAELPQVMANKAGVIAPETAQKLGQRGSQLSGYLEGSVNSFHSAGVRRAAYMSGAGLAGAAVGYRNRQQGYQSKNLSQGRLNSGRGNMLHR